ncbi:uncharacterized protein Dana_GF21447 [Drosophila ananassae]|uniref:Uncharacterized protein n=1 Tax=Drosophila ananassae TaxID=7217 RepID=B3MSD7_DROAN|nr:uncharacterized protein LOC6504130 [Drosophila ananassae]EDV34692.2 uncharacterized protein Dana_GF21447 [Drosophila ananassae]
MPGRWIIFTAISLAIFIYSPAESKNQTSDTLLEEGDKQLNLILQAINELEHQKWIQKGSSHNPNQNQNQIKQRPNSKRLRWNRRPVQPDPEEIDEVESRGVGGYSSSYTNPANPTYLDVDNFGPTPAPWWFN